VAPPPQLVLRRSPPAVPALGALALVVPFVELFQPGQPAPYSLFPYLSLAILIAAALAASYVVRRNPKAGAGEGAAGGSR
jgi:hypothetical protein